jgi:uncharacterized protein (TIGR00255 family)
MLKSMTGYGRAETTIGNQKITIELRSLNSKGIDLNIKSSNLFREKEMELRNQLSTEVIRGKCDLSIYVERLGVNTAYSIDKTIAKSYFDDIKLLEKELGIVPTNVDYMSTILKMPDVIQNTKEELNDDLWAVTQQSIKLCLEAFNEFRLQEGLSLAKDLKDRIDSIAHLLKQVEPFESVRLETVKERIRKNIDELTDKSNFDPNRFEQELIYYIEKYDISEEKVRLSNHLTYFIDTLNNEVEQGKKLGFISQEIGREINTLGSKANHLEIQKIVVVMKDELERIKEQILNVL